MGKVWAVGYAPGVVSMLGWASTFKSIGKCVNTKAACSQKSSSNYRLCHDLGSVSLQPSKQLIKMILCCYLCLPICCWLIPRVTNTTCCMQYFAYGWQIFKWNSWMPTQLKFVEKKIIYTWTHVYFYKDSIAFPSPPHPFELPVNFLATCDGYLEQFCIINVTVVAWKTP